MSKSNIYRWFPVLALFFCTQAMAALPGNGADLEGFAPEPPHPVSSASRLPMKVNHHVRRFGAVNPHYHPPKGRLVASPSISHGHSVTQFVLLGQERRR
jgi:hypothetical protein